MNLGDSGGIWPAGVRVVGVGGGVDLVVLDLISDMGDPVARHLWERS